MPIRDRQIHAYQQPATVQLRKSSPAIKITSDVRRSNLLRIDSAALIPKSPRFRDYPEILGRVLLLFPVHHHLLTVSCQRQHKSASNGLRPHTRCPRQRLGNDKGRLRRRRNPKILLPIIVASPSPPKLDP